MTKQRPIFRLVRCSSLVTPSRWRLVIDWIALACFLGFHDYDKWELADDALHYFRWIKYKRKCRHCGRQVHDYVDR